MFEPRIIAATNQRGLLELEFFAATRCRSHQVVRVARDDRGRPCDRSREPGSIPSRNRLCLQEDTRALVGPCGPDHAGSSTSIGLRRHRARPSRYAARPGESGESVDDGDLVAESRRKWLLSSSTQLPISSETSRASSTRHVAQIALSRRIKPRVRHIPPSSGQESRSLESPHLDFNVNPSDPSKTFTSTGTSMSPSAQPGGGRQFEPFWRRCHAGRPSGQSGGGGGTLALQKSGSGE